MPSATAVGPALVTVLLWASAFPFIRLALREFQPVPLAALRFAVAGLLMIGWLAAIRPKLPAARDGLRFILCGMIGIAFYNVLLNTGQRTVSSGAASFIVNTGPVVTAILAVFFLREAFRVWAWTGTAISFAGIGIIASDPGGLSFGAGAVLVFSAAVCQAVFFVLQRRLIDAYGVRVCAPLVVVLGAVCLLPWLPTALRQAQHASTAGLAGVIFLAVFPGAIGYATWAVTQARLGAARAANFLYLVAPAATVLAMPIAGELPTAITLIGGGTALAGVIIVNTLGQAVPGGPGRAQSDS